MENIEAFQEIKIDFEKLDYKDSSELDRLSRRLKMMISKVFEPNSDYLEDLNNIHFSPLYFYIDMPESRIVDAWNTGKNSTVNLIETITEELKLFPKNINANIIDEAKKEIDCSKVFIVHGHDDGAKETAARFVDKLGFKAIILHEQVDSGATIIEKLAKHTDVGFAIVLYTACDIGGVKSDLDNLKPRARQNVIFEHGLLIGKIGRKNVVALVKGDVEIPNHISGMVYKSMDEGGAWKYSIAREMKSSGYDVDMNKID